MNIGDKFICIRNNNGHTVGKFYSIIKLDKNTIELNVNEGTKTLFNNCCFDVIGRGYYLNMPIDKYSYFYDYFADSRKYRKLKLEKINESNLY